MIRLLLVLGSGELGGAERQALLLAEGLRRRRDLEVGFATMGSGGTVPARCRELGLSCTRLPRIESSIPLLSLWRCLGAALRIRRLRPDLVLPFTLPANRCVRLFRAIVGADRGYWNQRDADPPIHLLDRFALRREGFALANGPDAALALRSIRPDLRIGLVANGVRLPPARDSVEVWRRRLDAAGPIVLILANLHRGKGHGLTLQAWAERSADLHRLGAVLVFAGRDDGIAEDLKSMARYLGIIEDLRLPGQVDDIAGLLAATAVVLAPSERESCPNAVLEAMAAGRHIIASPIPAHRWLLGSQARYARESSEWGRHILEILSDSPLADSAVHPRIRHFTPQRMVAAITGLFGLPDEPPVRPSRNLAFLIPSKDRHAALARSLPGILIAAQLCRAEVLVCDQSNDATEVPEGVRLLHRPDLNGLPAARNALLRATDADLVCFLDDDTDVAADFGETALLLARQETDVVAWGPVFETRSSRMRRLHRLAHLGCFHDPRRLLARRVDRETDRLFGCGFVVRRREVLATGFDERRPGYALGEDDDFFRRLPGRKRFVRSLRAVHRRESSGRADPFRRGLAKGLFLRWVAARYGGGNPATLVHLALALAAAASGFGQEPGTAVGVVRSLLRGGKRCRW